MVSACIYHLTDCGIGMLRILIYGQCRISAQAIARRSGVLRPIQPAIASRPSRTTRPLSSGSATSTART